MPGPSNPLYRTDCPACGGRLRVYRYPAQTHALCRKQWGGCGQQWTFRKRDSQWIERGVPTRRPVRCHNCATPFDASGTTRRTCDDCNAMRGRVDPPYWHTPIAYTHCAHCARLFAFPSLRGKNQRSYCSTACRQAAANLERRRQRAAGQRRRSIPTSLRLRLAYQQEYRCWHCGILLNLSVTGAEDSLHIDHVIPVSKGGADTEDNLVASCARCNQTRGNWWTPQQLRAVSDAG